MACLRRGLVTIVALALFSTPGACAGKEAPKAPAAPRMEAPMTSTPTNTPPQEDISLGENQRVTLDGYKVALAKCWEEEKAGKKVLVAWLSVAKKGSGDGAKDLELSPGDSLPLGDAIWEVVSVRLESGDSSGAVTLRKK